MLFARLAAMSAVALSFSICVVQAQTRPSPERLEAIQERIASVKQEAISKLPDRLQRALSGGALNFLQFATAWQNIRQSFGEGPAGDAKLRELEAALENRSQLAAPLVSAGPISVSNPGNDFLFSIMAGFTQSETSTAWCGSSVVTGFNDSGSEFESAMFGPGGVSFAGAAASGDGGSTFRDVGYVNPGPNPQSFLAGDPVVNCTDANTFYYSQIGSAGTAIAPTSIIALSKSTNGGFTWEDPIAAVSKDAFTHMLDKDWSAIDPKHPSNIYASYTDFDVSGTVCGANVERIAIEIVHSTDGGTTWSGPTVIDQVCSTFPDFGLVQGSQIVVDSNGDVFVEWERFPTGFSTPVHELRIAKSTNHSATFGPSSKIDNAIATGDGFALQGNFRDFLTGNLAIDRSGAKSDGDLYLTWDDGRLDSRLDLESPSGFYQFANVLISRSADHGKTWSAPVRVNLDPLASSLGLGVDHFQPGVAVDPAGSVAVCWYDRRDDPLNYQISRYCGVSADFGASWTNARVDPTRWPPIHATDAFVNQAYLGDYDALASDNTKGSTGFQGAYGNVSLGAPVPNQNVFLVHVKK